MGITPFPPAGLPAIGYRPTGFPGGVAARRRFLHRQQRASEGAPAEAARNAPTVASPPRSSREARRCGGEPPSPEAPSLFSLLGFHRPVSREGGSGRQDTQGTGAEDQRPPSPLTLFWAPTRSGGPQAATLSSAIRTAPHTPDPLAAPSPSCRALPKLLNDFQGRAALLVLHGTTQMGSEAEKQKHHYPCRTPPAPAPLTAWSCCSQIAHSHRVLGVLGRPPAQSGHQRGALSAHPLLLANSCQLVKPCIGTAAACRPLHYSSR